MGSRLPLAKRVLFASILILLPLLLGLLGLEIYLRATGKRVDLDVATGRRAGPPSMSGWAFVDAFCAYRPKPGSRIGGKSVDRQGFISTPEIAVTKPPGTVRLVFLGGSSTAGTGVNLKDAETWPWKTVESLRRQTRVKIDYINGAAGGYTTFESYGRLWSRLRHFSPDFVVVYHGWNEMYYFRRVDDILSWRTMPDGSWDFGRPVQRTALYTPHAIDPLLRWSQVLSRLRLRLSRHLEGEFASADRVPLAADFDHRGLEIFRTNVKLFRETSKVIGARLLVAKQATLITPGAPPEQRRRCQTRYHGFGYDAHVRAYQGLYRVIDEEIPADSVIDVTPLSGRMDLFYDHVHPTPQGTTEIARLMADRLLPLIEEKARSSSSAPAVPAP
jgi:lysophospholipase L1-like esterase